MEKAGGESMNRERKYTLSKWILWPFLTVYSFPFGFLMSYFFIIFIAGIDPTNCDFSQCRAKYEAAEFVANSLWVVTCVIFGWLFTQIILRIILYPKSEVSQ